MHRTCSYLLTFINRIQFSTIYQNGWVFRCFLNVLRVGKIIPPAGNSECEWSGNHMKLLWNHNTCVCGIFLLTEGEYKTSSPYKWLSKAKVLQNASYFVRKCEQKLEQNRQYFWSQQHKISKKWVLGFIQWIWCRTV